MDIKRTLLWAVLTISGLMLYNNWLLYDGQQALFGPTPLTPNVSKPLEPKETQTGAPAVANPATPQTPATPPSAADLPKQAGLPQPQQGPSISVTNLTTGEKHSIKNDVLELEISTTGASVINAKLLKQLGIDKKPITLLQITPQNQYFVRSGLISATSNDLPNHTATFVLSKNGRAENKNLISFVSEKGGVRLEKTYFLSDGSYVVEVEHRITQISTQGAANPLVLYSELVRDGTAVSDSEFYSTFTGPALYTDKEKFTKIDFSDIEKNKANFKQKEVLADFRSDAGALLATKSGTKNELNATKTQALLSDILIETLGKVKANELLPANIGLEQVEVATIIDQYNELVLKQQKKNIKNNMYLT